MDRERGMGGPVADAYEPDWMPGNTYNKVLSSWLKIEIPPMPPSFTMNSHVFILRLKNGKYAALQLENYIGTDGTKCWLKSIINIHINYNRKPSHKRLFQRIGIRL